MSSESDYTLEQYQALKCALAEGAKVVRYQDKWIEYRSFDEMKKILGDMERELGLKKSRYKKRFGRYSNGDC
jgi:hypothetical protein